MINLTQPITGKQILYFVIGSIVTIITVSVITYVASMAWKRGQE